MRVLSDRIMTAAKDHECAWCHETILSGSQYRRYSVVGEEGFECSKAHIECIELVNLWAPEEYLFLDFLIEELRERGYYDYGGSAYLSACNAYYGSQE